MRRSKALAKIRAGETVKICSLGHPMPFYIKLAAHFGYDCIWLELEHRGWDDSAVQAMIAQCHLHDIDCMVRPPTLEKTRLYRLLEDGAAGVMIPHVSTVEKAQMLVEALKFPPIGDRGLDGAGLDNAYFTGAIETYPEDANRETFLVVQIETPQAVANVDAIAAVEGVDGLFIGPGDLGLRITRTTGHGLTMDQATKLVAEAAKRHGKAWGLPVATRDDLQSHKERGGQLLAHGGEFFGIRNMLEECSRNFD